MRTSHMRQAEGHRVGLDSNRDISQRLTYQQLLALNHDLSRENQQLKNIGNRLGNELRNLHSQFDMRLRQENVELYNAINNHPLLNKYELTLIPLLDSYEIKIQEFEHGFENINQEFINLQKKYEEVTVENERLRGQLTDKISEIVEIYRTCSSEKLGGDFSQMILQQINEKQRVLVEENARLERQSQKYKAESEKYMGELADCKKRLQQASGKAKRGEARQEQLEKENKFLKDDIFNLKSNGSNLENELKRMSSDLERAETQIAFLSKNKEELARNIQKLKAALDQKENYSNNYQDRKTSLDSREKSISQESHPSDDNHKKLAKLQKDYDGLIKERNKLKDQLEQSRAPLEEANDRIAQLKKRLEGCEDAKSKVEASEFKAKKLYEKLLEKSKEDLQIQYKRHESELQDEKRLHEMEIQKKTKKIFDLEKKIENLNMQKGNLESERAFNSLLSKDQKQLTKNKESSRDVEKLKEKLKLTEQLFREQIQITENDYNYVKSELEKAKGEGKEKAEELRRIKQELDKTKKDLSDITEQKSLIIQEIKRIRIEYEGNLKEKELLFDRKIREIKTIVEESERRRKADKEKVSEASRQFKRVLEDIKSTYEERIRGLESELGNSKVKRIDY